MEDYNWLEIIERVNDKYKSKFVFDDIIDEQFASHEYFKLVLNELKCSSMKELRTLLESSLKETERKQFELWDTTRESNQNIDDEYDLIRQLKYGFGFAFDRRTREERESNLRYRDMKEYLLSVAAKKNILTKNWKRILNKILCQKLSITGCISWDRGVVRSEKSIALNQHDRTSFLALRSGLNNPYIIEKDNSISLSLSGGILAKFEIREIGTYLKGLKTDATEIFVSQHYGYMPYSQITHDENAFQSHVMYSQSGYTNSEILVETSLNYYILIDNYVVEITFESAPILFGNQNVMMNFQDMPSRSKIEDEEEAERIKQEEEEEEYYRQLWDD